MKKNLFYYLFAVICSVTLFASCSDDDDKIVCPIDGTVFTDQSGLQLTYSGAPMFGKVVQFEPQGDKAVLTLSGVTLSNEDLQRADMSIPAIATAGVVPGEQTTILNVDLVIEGDNVSFEGTDEKDGRVLRYKGTATKSGMQLDLNVTLSENELAGTSWNLAPTAFMGTSPIHIVWNADEFPFNGSTWDIDSALKLTLGMAPIKDQMTIPQLLFGVLNKVTFLADGNIQAEYKDNLDDADWKTSPLNLATYTVKNGKLYVYLNAVQIAAVADKSRAMDMSFISGLVNYMMPMLAEGIPLSYSTDEQGQFVVYLDKEVLLPLLKQVAPLFEDEATVNGLVELLKANAAEMAGLVDAFLKPVLVAFPNIIATTTDIQIGLTLLPTE